MSAQNVHLNEVKRGPRSNPKPGGYPGFWTVGPGINPVVTLVSTGPVDDWTRALWAGTLWAGTLWARALWTPCF